MVSPRPGYLESMLRSGNPALRFYARRDPRLRKHLAYSNEVAVLVKYILTLIKSNRTLESFLLDLLFGFKSERLKFLLRSLGDEMVVLSERGHRRLYFLLQKKDLANSTAFLHCFARWIFVDSIKFLNIYGPILYQETLNKSLMENISHQLSQTSIREIASTVSVWGLNVGLLLKNSRLEHYPFVCSLSALQWRVRAV